MEERPWYVFCLLLNDTFITTLGSGRILRWIVRREHSTWLTSPQNLVFCPANVLVLYLTLALKDCLKAPCLQQCTEVCYRRKICKSQAVFYQRYRNILVRFWRWCFCSASKTLWNKDVSDQSQWVGSSLFLSPPQLTKSVCIHCFISPQSLAFIKLLASVVSFFFLICFFFLVPLYQFSSVTY